jgi:hypothetical protein
VLDSISFFLATLRRKYILFSIKEKKRKEKKRKEKKRKEKKRKEKKNENGNGNGGTIY